MNDENFDDGGGPFTVVGRGGKPLRQQTTVTMDSAPTGGENASNEMFNGLELKEKVRFEILSQVITTNVHKEVKTMVSAIFDEDPDAIIYSDVDTNYFIKKGDEFPKNSEDVKKLFKFETYANKNRNGGKVHILFNLASHKGIKVMNKSATFKKVMQELGAWITEHMFHTDKIATIGFITKKHFAYTDKEEFCYHISSQFTGYVVELYSDVETRASLIKKTHMDIINKTVSAYFDDTENEGKQKRFETIAFEVRCDTENADVVKQFLISLTNTTKKYGRFVPYDLFRNDKELAAKVILENNEYLSDCKKFSIYGIPPNIMTENSIYDDEVDYDISQKEYLVKLKKDYNGSKMTLIDAIEKCPRSEAYGEWYILTTKDREKGAREVINDFINDIKSDGMKYEQIVSKEGYERGARISGYVESSTNRYLRETIKAELSLNTTNTRNYTKKMMKTKGIRLQVGEVPLIDSNTVNSRFSRNNQTSAWRQPLVQNNSTNNATKELEKRLAEMEKRLLEQNNGSISTTNNDLEEKMDKRMDNLFDLIAQQKVELQQKIEKVISDTEKQFISMNAAIQQTIKDNGELMKNMFESLERTNKMVLETQANFKDALNNMMEQNRQEMNKMWIHFNENSIPMESPTASLRLKTPSKTEDNKRLRPTVQTPLKTTGLDDEEKGDEQMLLDDKENNVDGRQSELPPNI